MLSFQNMVITNFGPYKGTQDISFPQNDGVDIFWGDNGRGKTTLLNAFRFALFGTIQRRNNALNTLMSLENHEAREAGEYGFSIVLHMRSEQNDYLLTREFIPRQGVSVPQSEEDYVKRQYLKKNGSMLSPEDSEHELGLLLPEHVSRFFLFDGELLQEYEELLIDDTVTGERIKSAIERILGVPVLTNSRQDIDMIHSQLSKQKTKAVRDDDQTQQFSNTLDGIEAGIDEHSRQITELEQQLKEQYTEQVRIEERMKSTEQLRSWQTEIENFRKSLARNQQAFDGQLLEMKAAMKDAWRGMLKQRIDECLTDVRERMNLLEVKQSRKTITDKVISDLRKALEDRKCPVCEQGINGAVLATLSARLQESISDVGLNSDEKRELTEVTDRLHKLTLMLKESSRSKVRNIENQIASLGIAIDEDRARIKELQQRISEYGGNEDDNVRDLPVRYSRVLQKIDNLNAAKRGELAKLDEKRKAKEMIMAQIRKLEGGSDLRDATQRLDLCQQLYQLFEEGVAKYSDAVRKHVEHDATELFVAISGDPDYVSLQINGNYGLSIVHKSGALVPGRSSGYEHIVALSLIGALHKNAPLRGPIIMDSPFGRLDKTHKRHIARTLPSMANQVILLTYNGEIERSIAIDELSSHLLREFSLERVTSMHTHIKQGV